MFGIKKVENPSPPKVRVLPTMQSAAESKAPRRECGYCRQREGEGDNRGLSTCANCSRSRTTAAGHARGRTGFEDDPYPQAAYAWGLVEKLNALDLTPVLESSHQGKALGQAIYDFRLQFLKTIVQKAAP